jgi:hypothetical protein
VADHDPLQELRSLVETATGRQVHPLPVEEVRARGTRRRRRRHAAVAGSALLVALLVGGRTLPIAAATSSTERPDRTSRQNSR